MTLYLDTSALLKLYVDERESVSLRARTAAATELTTSVIAYPEARAALAAMRRSGRLSEDGYRRSVAGFEAEWLGLMVVGVSAGLCQRAGEMAERFALRGFDSVHLACFAEIAGDLSEQLEFLSFDARLNRAARLWMASR